jgi:hypothetical protein
MISLSPKTNSVIDTATYRAIVCKMGMIAILEHVLTTLEGTPHRVCITINSYSRSDSLDDKCEAHIAVLGTLLPEPSIVSSQDAPLAYSLLSLPTLPSPCQAVPQTGQVALTQLAALVPQPAAGLPTLGARPFKTPPWMSIAWQLTAVEVLERCVHPHQQW